MRFVFGADGSAAKGATVAAWRRRADELLPELRTELARTPKLTPYGVLFELLTFVRLAHRRDDHDALRRGYAYALWCHLQRWASDLPNAAAVAFYEHLFDEWGDRLAVVPWLAPTVRTDVWVLWERRLDAAQTAELRTLLSSEQPEHWREVQSLATMQ